jgi:hypothetical protein
MKIKGSGGTITIDGAYLSPEHSQRIMNHSPDGFNWGYHGSGPSQLALAILLAAGVPATRAESLYHQFKRDFVAMWPPGFELDIDVDAWVKAQR